MTASSPEDALSLLIDSLVIGFETLLSHVRENLKNEKLLRDRLEFAANEYQRLLAADSSLSASSAAHSDVAKQIRGRPSISTNIEELAPVRQAQQAIKLYKMSRIQDPQPNIPRCPVAHSSRNPEDLERDFTTPGVRGTLGCPFAKVANGLAPSTQNDPIAAEFHQDKASTLSPPVDQRPGKCPIRFLDQHSPEEVAKYFENHKHEIPRSHEICVRRYGGNESSARQLDAKYGNLVNMIQGLGVKHKAYLPERDRIEERDKGSAPGVEKWAENVSQDATSPVQETAEPVEDPRLSHFERPLREVRVGESPSRPWGISVPADNEPTPSALQDEDGAAHLKMQSASSRPTPVATPDGEPAERSRKPQQQENVETTERTQIIFNGPVFFGYSAEEVALLLQKTNLADTKPGSG
ncbi:hypothetical protein PV04_01085 [Phialophora macrospora]|uniref:Uncharacterized protein n=1 Tax=Phialophora macrospora TaxID=1851006 RepID=A0A0D2D5R1_9EURO|nr:hypothetical protein PV04_01085 [Phialophora macrospora]